MKYLILMLTGLMAFNLHAEVDTSDLAGADESIESPSLNIEGQLKTKEVIAPIEEKKEVKKVVEVAVRKPLSQSERMRLLRARLEERNKIMVEKKMEQIRWQQEVALAKKLEESMNKTIQAIDIK